MAGPDLFSDNIAIGRIRNLAERGDEASEMMIALYEKTREHEDAIEELEEGGGELSGNIVAESVSAISDINVGSAGSAGGVRVSTPDAFNDGDVGYSYTKAGAGPGKTLTGTNNEALAIDGVTLDLGDLVLISQMQGNITNQRDKGVYEVTATGEADVSPWVLTRATEYDTTEKLIAVHGKYFHIAEGNVNGETKQIILIDLETVIDVDMASGFNTHVGDVEISPGMIRTPGNAAIGGDVEISGDLEVGENFNFHGILKNTGDALQLGLNGDDVLIDEDGVHLGSAEPGFGKVAAFGAPPILQPSSTGQTGGFAAGAGTPVLAGSTSTGGVGTKAYTLGDIVRHLKNLGWIAAD